MSASREGGVYRRLALLLRCQGRDLLEGALPKLEARQGGETKGFSSGDPSRSNAADEFTVGQGRIDATDQRADVITQGQVSSHYTATAIADRDEDMLGHGTATPAPNQNFTRKNKKLLREVIERPSFG
jgi:hypothetical protein